MRFAYADPPYLGQGASRYGHLHPDAAIWDAPATHTALVERLEDEYPDGWAISTSSSPAALMAYVGPRREVAIWHRPASIINGKRIGWHYEMVIYRTTVPNDRRSGPMVSNVFTLGGHNWQLQDHTRTHTGTKPLEFCRWVLDLLGFNPAADELVDLFPGAGAMTRAAHQHRLILWDPDQARRRHRDGAILGAPLAQDTLPL